MVFLNFFSPPVRSRHFAQSHIFFPQHFRSDQYLTLTAKTDRRNNEHNIRSRGKRPPVNEENLTFSKIFPTAIDRDHFLSLLVLRPGHLFSSAFSHEVWF